MIYSNSPLYIRKEDNTQLTNSAVNVYDPSGDANSLIFYNNNENRTATLQYLNSPLVRVSGNIDTTTSDQLFAPNIYSANGQDVKVLIPKFRTLRFYNLNGSRLLDPLDPSNFFPDLIPYTTGSNSIIYTSSLEDYYYRSLEWFRATDTYTVSIPNYGPYVYYTGKGTGFSSGWYDAQTSTYTGILCSGLPYPISGIYNAFNDPTGKDDAGYRKAATYSNATGILSAQYFGDYTGYARAGNILVLGANFSYIPAASVSIDTQSASVGKRTIDSNINQDAEFVNAGALQTKISFNCYLNTDSSGSLNKILDSTGDSLYTIKLNNNVYSGCYLSNYDINIQPHKPVNLTANYISTKSPEINENKSTMISELSQKGSTNFLLNSQNLTGNTWINTRASFQRVLDPTGGNDAFLMNSLSANQSGFRYSIDNSQSYTYATISGVGIRLTSLTSATNQDLSANVAFTGKYSAGIYAGQTKFIQFYTPFYQNVNVTNNGLLVFDNPSYVNYQNKSFPIFNANGGLIAPYWKDLGSSVGNVWYKELDDRLIIEYHKVGASPMALTPAQTFQVHLFFDPVNIIEIRYNSVSASNVFNPNPSIGIQSEEIIENPQDFLNYNLALVDLSKSLRFLPTSITRSLQSSLIYKQKINPSKDRTFSVSLRRAIGGGPINYTLNSGLNWSTIYGITDEWQRFTFPYNKDNQQVGIQIPTNTDAIAIYGPQLEDSTYSTDYIPTTASTASRADVFITIDNTYYQYANLQTGFVNNMINGNTCSLSNIAPITDIVQNSYLM